MENMKKLNKKKKIWINMNNMKNTWKEHHENKMNKTWNKMMKEYMATPKAYWMLGLASKHGSLEVLFGKHQWMVLFYWRKQGFKGQKKRTMEPVLFSKKQNISKKIKQSKTISNNLKKSQKKNSKNLKISQNFSNVVSQTWFCETGFFIAYFSGPQKISKNLKKSQKNSKNLKIIQICRKKAKKRKNTIKPNKLMQTYKNLGPSLRFLPCFLKQ